MFKNFIWQREDEPQNMLSYLFLFINICYGIEFAFNSNSDTVQRSSFTSSSAYIAPQIWGYLTLTLGVLTLLSIAFRIRFIGQAIGMAGFMIWLYGFQVYLADGKMFAGFTFYFTQMLFWVFWFIGVNRFYAREDRAKGYRQIRPPLKEDEPGR